VADTAPTAGGGVAAVAEGVSLGATAGVGEAVGVGCAKANGAGQIQQTIDKMNETILSIRAIGCCYIEPMSRRK
ncbi:MAG TPA: hypothetical protein VE860_01435, partial [Chthoniobacterales bacterium]|nr:hypothetical protein [Chthoniobacterales bacterium]